MATITTTKCLEVPIQNQPGKLAELTRLLAGANVNILGINTIPGKNVVQFVVNDPTKAETTLKGKGLNVTPINVLGVRIPNKPGSLAEACEKLAKSGINIEQVYGFTPTNATEGEILFRVADVSQAQKILQ